MRAVLLPEISSMLGAPCLAFETWDYDAAGDMTSDGSHAYTYDADGNVTAVDSGSTAQYVYNALNQRVKTTTSAGSYEYLCDAAGHRMSQWLTSNSGYGARIYWDNQILASRATNGHTYFEGKNWLGTERIRTDYAANVVATYASLAFGDGSTVTSSNPDAEQDTPAYAMLDMDNESGTGHAQFRQYSPTLAQWLSPDPYSGSYDLSNPESLDRYSYAENNPLSYVDPGGLKKILCPGGIPCEDYYGAGNTGFLWGQFWNEFDLLYAAAQVTDTTATVLFNGSMVGSYEYIDTSIYSLLFDWTENSFMIGGAFPGSAANKYNPYNTNFKPLFCSGDALKAKGLSIGLDVVGAIPGLGNMVSAAAAGARAVDSVVTWGGGVLGAATSLDDPVGAASSGAGLGLALANVTIQSTKVIPGIGNFISAGTGIYDAYGAYKAYQSCMSSSKYD